MTRWVKHCWTALIITSHAIGNQAFTPNALTQPHRSASKFERGHRWAPKDAVVRQLRHRWSRWPICMVTSVGDNTPPAIPDPLQPASTDYIDNSTPVEAVIREQQQAFVKLPNVLEDEAAGGFLDNVRVSPGDSEIVSGVSDPSEGAHDKLSSRAPPALSVWQGRAIVIGAAAIYGTNFAAIKLLDPVIPVAVSAAFRFTLAAIAVTAAVLWNEVATSKAGTQRRAENKNWLEVEAWWLGGEVGAWYCVGYLCQAWGLHFVDASKSAFFNSLAVIVVPLLDSLFKRKRLGWTALASIAMALGGVALLELGPGPDPAAFSIRMAASAPFDLSSFVHLGDVLCLSQAIFFGIGYWRLEAASTKYPDESGPITAGQLLAIAFGSLAYWLVSTGSDLPTQAQVIRWFSDPFVVGAIAWTGLVSTAFALWLETVALSVVSATELTILMTSVSLWGSFFAYVSMGETLSSVGLMGGVLIMLGCILTSLDKKDNSDDSGGTVERP